MRRTIAGPLAALITLLALLAAPAHAQAQTTAGYRIDERTCDGYPRLPIGMADGMCAGLVYTVPPGARPQTGIGFPRTVLELPDGDILIVAMGGWRPGVGSVWRLSNRPGRTPGLRRLLNGLSMPHLAAFGPDGRLYLGEMNRIIRFDPDAADPAASVETVIDNLPSNQLHANRHPLSAFLFDADGSLILNVGAPTDQCAAPAPRPGTPCAEAVGSHAAAALWRYRYLGQGRWNRQPTVLATGLRNSMAIARHATGAIFQAENSIDLASENSPFEELNLIAEGGAYGWPYCMDIRTPTPAWRGTGIMDCASAAHTAPIMLLAPHGAPLSMLYYDGPMFPQLQGRLLISLHGFRPTGGRIMAYEVGKTGAPILTGTATYPVYRAGAGPIRRRFPERGATGLNLTPNWDAVPGTRPMGRPVGLMVARDGALWVADDRNGTIIRIAADRR